MCWCGYLGDIYIWVSERVQAHAAHTSEHQCSERQNASVLKIIIIYSGRVDQIQFAMKVIVYPLGLESMFLSIQPMFMMVMLFI